MPKYWAEKKFRTREFPRSGSKAKDGEEKKEEREKERLNDGNTNNNGQATHGARKPPGPKFQQFSFNCLEMKAQRKSQFSRAAAE